MIHINAADIRFLEHHEAKYHRVKRGGMMNAIFDVTEDQAIDGQVLAFNVAFPYKGDFVMLRSGCFGNINNRRVGFRIDHEQNMEAASTDDGLELMLDADVLQFRLDLSKCKNGHVIARMCNVDSRSAMSHGSDILEEHRETINGQSVRVVTRARLNELTICKEGAAGVNAYAMVVDKTVTPKPVAGSRSASMQAGQILHRVSRAVKTLKAQVLATYADSKTTPHRSMTLDQSNRAQTEMVERLQEDARRHLR